MISTLNSVNNKITSAKGQESFTWPKNGNEHLKVFTSTKTKTKAKKTNRFTPHQSLKSSDKNWDTLQILQAKNQKHTMKIQATQSNKPKDKKSTKLQITLYLQSKSNLQTKTEDYQDSQIFH